MVKNNTLILGVGNTYRKDDGVGPAIIALLQNNKRSGVDYLDGGVDGLALIDIISLYSKVIIIDAVDMKTPPGTVKLFSPSDVRLQIKSDALSTHGFGLAEVIKLIEQLDVKTLLQIIGIQPQDISFGEGLSEVIEKQVQRIIKLVDDVL